MGILCCKKNKVALSEVIETEKEISIPSFSSAHDKHFTKLETQFNVLKDISFSHYAKSLSNFTLATATITDDYSKTPESYSKSDPFLKEPFSSDLFQSFIENKIFKHPQLYTTIGNNESLASIFKEAFLEIHKALGKKLQQADKEKGGVVIENRVTKTHLMALGILYCGGSNVSKAKFIFDIFKDNNVLQCSDDFKDFLLSLFLIPAYCMLYARNKLASHAEIGEFPKETMKQILDSSELKDSMNLVDVTVNRMFGQDSAGIGYEKFKDMFTINDGIGYLLSPKGVRQTLLKNNV